jgi:hypothetical protein
MLDGDETTTDPPIPSGLFHGHLACSHGRVRCIGCDKRPFCVHLWTKCRPRDDAPRILCSDCGDLHVRPDDCPHFHECDDPDCPTCNPCSCDDPDCSQCHPLDEREVV